MNLFIVTAANPEARIHLKDSIASPVPKSGITGQPSQALFGATVDPSNIRCWGSIPGEANLPRWERMQPADELLIYAGKSVGFAYQARVLDTVRDAVTAESIWGTDGAGSTWELMYFLEVEELVPPRPLSDVADALGYAPNWVPQGFQRVRGSVASLGPSPGTPGGPSTKPYVSESELVPKAPAPSEPDPDVVGRGINAHRKINNDLADALKTAGLPPEKGGVGWPNVDLCWRDEDGVRWIAEVKSLTSKNETHQLRLGVGQLSEFRSRVRSLFPGETVRAALVVEREPSDADLWTSVCQETDLLLIWPPNLTKALSLI